MISDNRTSSPPSDGYNLFSESCRSPAQSSSFVSTGRHSLVLKDARNKSGHIQRGGSQNLSISAVTNYDLSPKVSPVKSAWLLPTKLMCGLYAAVWLDW